jgi:hypothetical protein
VPAQCVVEQTLEVALIDIERSELIEVRIWKLRIEKRIAAIFQARGQMHQRHLARVAP